MDPATTTVDAKIEDITTAPTQHGHTNRDTVPSSVHQSGEDGIKNKAATGLSDAQDDEGKSKMLASPIHKASSPRTAEALREFKRKMGLCAVETCEHKSVSMKGDVNLCQYHLDSEVDASAVEQLRCSRKRKAEENSTVGDDGHLQEQSILNPPLPADTPLCNTSADDESSALAKNTCKVEGCEKFRAKGGFCTRHFKDRSAPNRGGPTDYERRYCMKEGCGKLQSKGVYCHRHNQDINAPIRSKTAQNTDRRRQCSVKGCDRLRVKGGYCSRHSKNPEAPVKDTPAFTFDADARWEELFPKLEAFTKQNGHARYPTSKKTDMAKFVTQIRSVYRQKRNKSIKGNPNADPSTVEPDLSSSKLLTPERVADLQAIGFEFQLWTVEPGQWEQRFQGNETYHLNCIFHFLCAISCSPSKSVSTSLELLQYKQKHGNFNVTTRENATLSSWCKTQRQRYKNTMAIYQGIYGEEFTGTQQKAQQLFEKAKGMTEDARDQGMTIEISLVTEAKHTMDPEKICKLTAVGFAWDLQKDSFEESWETRYMELMRFKLLNANCRVPKTGDNP
jgi:hypothetical protein